VRRETLGGRAGTAAFGNEKIVALPRDREKGHRVKLRHGGDGDPPSSSPVESTATRGRLTTGNSPKPQAASIPSSRELMRCLRRSTASPRAISGPANETDCPRPTTRRTTIAGPSGVSNTSVCSIITTASAPRGMCDCGRGACPYFERRRMTASDHLGIKHQPAALLPIVSAARTANPSTPER
jgi:hypothetical protein